MAKKKLSEIEKEREKEKLGRKRKKRLTRFLFLCLVVFLLVVLVKFLANEGTGQSAGGKIRQPILKETIEDFGETVLGVAVRYLPNAPDLEEIDKSQLKKIDPEAEPIKEPTENIRQQTESLLESIKALPQDQIEAIKRQIYKDFCQNLIREEKKNE